MLGVVQKQTLPILVRKTRWLATSAHRWKHVSVMNRRTSPMSWNVTPQLEQFFRKQIVLQCGVSDTLYSAQDSLISSVSIQQLKSRLNSEEENIYESLTNADIVTLLTQAVHTDFYTAKAVLPSLQEELLSRQYTFTKPQLLYTADVFYHLNKRGVWRANQFLHKFNQLLYRRRREKEMVLEPSQIIQVLFYIGLLRHAPNELMNHFEETFRLHPNLIASTYTVDEISLICHSYFVSNTRFTDTQVLQQLSDRLLTQLKCSSLNSHCLVSILKTFRHAGYNIVSFYDNLAQHLCSTEWIQQQNTITLAHIAKTFSSLKITNDLLMDRITQRVMRLAEHSGRAKDMTLVVVALAGLNCTVPPQLLDSVVKQWRDNVKLRDTFPMLFTELLLSLAILQVYPHELLDYAFSSHFLHIKLDDEQEQAFQMLVLDLAVSLEGHSYTGNRIPQKYREELNRCLQEKAVFSEVKELTSRLGLSQLLDGLQELVTEEGHTRNSSKVKLTILIPSLYVPDIVMQFAPDGTAQNLTLLEAENEQFLEQLERKTQQVLDNQLVEQPNIDCFDRTAQEMFGEENDRGDSLFRQMLREYDLQHPLLSYRTDMDIAIYKPKVNRFHPNSRVTVKAYSNSQYLRNVARYQGLRELEIRLLTAMGYTVLVVPPSFSASLGTTKSRYVQKKMIQKQILDPLMKTLRQNSKDKKPQFHPSQHGARKAQRNSSTPRITEIFRVDRLFGKG